jgi:hypothetical protein
MFRPIRFLSTQQPDSVEGDFDVLCNRAAVVAQPAEMSCSTHYASLSYSR